jgi:hypothetical protein
MRHSFISTSLVAIAAVGMIGLSGCGRDEPKATAPGIAAPTNDVPDWVNDPSQGGKVLGAYGVAEKALAGEAKQISQARLKAREELAATLSSKIQGVIKDWVREGGIITSQDNAQSAMVSFESATRNVINQNLEGSQQKARYVDTATGKLYVYVVVNPDIAAKIAEAAKAAARENKELRAHMAAKIEADKAFADLDKLIDKEMGVAK